MTGARTRKAWRRAAWVCALAVAVLPACAQLYPHFNARELALLELAGPGKHDAAKLARGRALFVQKCSGCHGLPKPTEYPADEWPDQVDAMAEDAKVSVDEAKLIAAYLAAAQVFLTDPKIAAARQAEAQAAK